MLSVSHSVCTLDLISRCTLCNMAGVTEAQASVMRRRRYCNVGGGEQYLMETFQNQVIGYGGFVEWSQRSPDFTPMDFFLWGYIKGQVYATPPPTLQDLRLRITDACAS
ncbi:hypothetical protein AVEN_207779-1 [Araneus ventricosus]|uniref:Uncharacterized protein n=1 Tax=Araneus ventricosus TaxID=182803 RepID=A0A4Y2BYG9_ARAVE|nr:hypothetical protein AVEN_207779-1 [Araneus ventricosus]